MCRIMLSKSKGSETTTYLESPTLICLFTIQLLWSYTVTIKGSLLSRAPTVSDFRLKIFESVFSPKIDVWGPKQGLNVTFNFCNPKKAHPCVISRLLSHHASKSVERSHLWVVPRKKGTGICMYVTRAHQEMRYPNVTWRITFSVYFFTTELRQTCRPTSSIFLSRLSGSDEQNVTR